MITRQDIAALVTKIDSDSRHARDPGRRLRMKILREVIRYLDYAELSWRETLTDQLNKAGVDAKDIREPDFDTLSYHLKFPLVDEDFDFRDYLQSGE